LAAGEISMIGDRDLSDLTLQFLDAFNEEAPFHGKMLLRAGMKKIHD
jgi:hypothetical protein